MEFNSLIPELNVTDINQKISILEKCKVLHLAMISDDKPYSVPVNFGYYKIPAGIKKIAYEAMALAKTMVCKIEVEEISGKVHLRK